MWGNRVQITRDEKISKMSNEVYSNLAEIARQFDPKPEPVVDKFGALPLISVEQAIKELIELENEINKKES
jgi:hypothetical protein